MKYIYTPAQGRFRNIYIYIYTSAKGRFRNIYAPALGRFSYTNILYLRVGKQSLTMLIKVKDVVIVNLFKF